MDLLRAVDDLRRGDDVAKAPAGDGIGLGKRRAGQRALPHVGQRRKIGVLVRGVNDVLVDLVSDDVDVIFLGKTRDDLKLLAREDLAAGVRGVAQHERLGVLAERVLEHFGVKRERRRRERHIDGHRAGEDRVGTVIFVERGEDDDLVAGIGDGHHCGHHGLGAAAGDDDLAVGVDVAAHEVGLLLRQRLAEVLRAPGDGVLMIVLVGDLREAVEDGLGRVEVGEALGKIHCAVLVGDTGHAADDGIGKARGAVRKCLHYCFLL